MKAIVFIVVLAIGAALIWLTTASMSKDPGYSMGMVFGLADEDTIQMHAIVSGTMVRIDPPPLIPGSGFQSWPEWVADHFQLKTRSGETVKLNRQGSSGLVPATQATNTGFYLLATLKTGEAYVLQYHAVMSEPNLYRHRFVAPSDETKVVRVNLIPVER